MDNIHLKDKNAKLQSSVDECGREGQNCRKDLEGCVNSIDDQVIAETTITQEQLNECNSNFEARVKGDLKQVEEELKECQGVKSELLENVSRLEGVDTACQMELDAGG